MVRRNVFVAFALFGLVTFLVAGTMWHDASLSRELAARAACESHLRQVFQGIKLYRAAHEGRYPDRLRDLYPSCVPSREWLACAVSPRRPFEYLGASPSSSHDSIMVYDYSDRHKKDHGTGARPCVIVLLRDGRILQMDPDTFRARLREQLSTRGGASDGSSQEERPVVSFRGAGA
jgi:hypothetical protein